MLTVDTREKRWEHVRAYFDSRGVEYISRKLDVGDYMLEGGDISVDRKHNLSELSRNLMNRADHSRFWKEIRRARAQGIKLYVLCEHGGGVRSIRDVAGWSDKYSGVSGRALMEALYRLHIAWGVEIIFCSPDSTGEKIIEILKGGVHE